MTSAERKAFLDINKRKMTLCDHDAPGVKIKTELT